MKTSNKQIVAEPIVAKTPMKTPMLPSVGVNDLVKRQTPDSKFSYFAGTWMLLEREQFPDVWQELADLVQQAFPEGKEGYRDGVLLVPVNPEGFFTNVVTLVDGDVLSGSFASRRKGEAPRKEFSVVREGASIQHAQSVEVILYRSDVLAEDDDASTDAQWEIISINAYPTEGGEGPIHPETLCHNHFGSDGGTETRMTNDEFVAALQTSFEFWANKGLLDQGQ
jgi:hypothetical protein